MTMYGDDLRMQIVGTRGKGPKTTHLLGVLRSGWSISYVVALLFGMEITSIGNNNSHLS